MLTLTDNARTVVQDLTSRAGLPDGGGLRIARSTEQLGSFELALVAEPVPGDDVVDAGDAKVYLGPEASATLADQRLDVDPAGGGQVFTLSPQD